MKSCFTRSSRYVKDAAVLPSHRCKSHLRPGLTLIEMTIVMCVLMTLIGTSLYVGGSIKTWRAGREAAEALRTVYSAQRMFLADNPTLTPASLTSDLIIPYLPNRAIVMPTVKPLSGGALTIRVNSIPPVVLQAGSVYDPSGKPNDNLWDVGE